MICPSCGNKFLQPFVCTRCLYNVRSAEAARPQPEVLENENAELQAMLEKCNSKFIVELEAENAALRDEIRKLNQMGFTHENAAAQKAAIDKELQRLGYPL